MIKLKGVDQSRSLERKTIKPKIGSLHPMCFSIKGRQKEMNIGALRESSLDVALCLKEGS